LTINLTTDKLSSGFTLFELESHFYRSSERNCDLYKFIVQLLNKTPWLNLVDDSGFYRTICLELAKEVEDHNSSMGISEPAYHNRDHFQDVCTSLTLLLNQNISKLHLSEQWNLLPEDLWMLLLCAIGHDFGHNGTINQLPQELEKKSIEKIEHLLNKINLTSKAIEQVMSRIEPIILATDPSSLTKLLDKISSGPTKFNKTDSMCMLMVESDLLASALPKHGQILGQMLAEEWAATNPQGALAVASKEGRIKFLEYIRFISPHAIMLGMEVIRKESINQLKNTDVR
jgi:hypothetical protein